MLFRSKKIRNAEMSKVNYIIVVGKKELVDKTINIRKRGAKDQIVTDLKKFMSAITKEIKEHSMTSHLH